MDDRLSAVNDERSDGVRSGGGVADVTADGRVLVDRPRMYNLVRNPDFEQHELTLRITMRGFGLYAFSFTGCVKSN